MSTTIGDDQPALPGAVLRSRDRGRDGGRPPPPRALGFDDFRWHIRVYCHTNNDFRDFLFSRISSIVSERQSTTDGSLDTAWNHNVVVKIGPHPLLSDEKRRAVEIEYEMTSGVASIETRVALLFYLLKRLELLDPIQEQRPPETQLIVLRIPAHAGTRFRRMPAHHSGRCRQVFRPCRA